MITNRKIHKITGLIAGIFILLLSITGLFLNHDNWKFLHNTTFDKVPSNIYELNNRAFTAYWINPKNEKHIIVGNMRGAFESFDEGSTFNETLNEIIYSIKDDNNAAYLATANGIYKKGFQDLKWQKYLLDGKLITSLNIYKDRLIAVEDKTNVILIDLNNNIQISSNTINISKELLNIDINLSRFVRDLHYGRGIFDGDISLLINDFASIILIVLGFSGFILWLLIKNVKKSANYKNSIKYFVKIHSNFFALLAILPIVILTITGIFLDHGKDLNKFMKSIVIENSYLPPVYRTLRSDIWGTDFDGDSFYIGNRYGVFKTNDFKNYEFVSKGFAYGMIRKENVLYVSGMGSSNRALENNQWIELDSVPHMFKDVFTKDGKIEYLSSHQNNIKVPTFNNVTLYTVLYSLHDGSFFAAWWIWVNDFTSVVLLILLFTGSVRWYLRKRKNK
jgi:hypothetical protein